MRTRRQFLSSAGAAGAGLGLAAAGLDPWVEAALAAPRRPGSLKDIEHVVFLIQENRSFDHYFGTYRGVRGFADKRGRAAFRQHGFDRNGGVLEPFHIDRKNESGYCTSDITHEWGAQHRSWNHGRMNRFVAEHLKDDGPGAGPLTMGYYRREDIPFYYRLADAFTLCDGYHCSVMGPTDPNRLYSMSATLDPAGHKGGPLLQTLVGKRGDLAGKFRWTTMPEQLSARRIPWKVYSSTSGGVLDNVLPYFKSFQTNGRLKARGLDPTYPQDFLADIKGGRLPKVSWILTSLAESEHPGFSSAQAGERAAYDVVSALMKNRKAWEKTALFITWDENGGFFDHVAPPTPPKGTKGEFVTVKHPPAVTQGIRGPIGLGFRVPMLIVSPFSRGGFVSSDTFDHTSMLRFLETRFGAEVPNLTHWRREHTGDLTSAFNFARPDASRPRLGRPTLTPAQAEMSCGVGAPPPYPVPRNRMPGQERGKAKRPSGPVRHKKKTKKKG